MRRYPALSPPRSGMLAARWAVPAAAMAVFLVLVTVAQVVGRRRFDLGPISLALLVAAAWLVAHATGTLDALREWNWRRLRRRCPQEPWFADHRWNPRGDRRGGLRSLGDSSASLMLGALAALQGAIALSLPAPVGPILAGVAAVGLSGITVHLVRRMSRGVVEVVWTRFPFHPGDPLELHMGSAPGGPTLEDCVLTLRRVEEHPRSRWTWWSRVVPTYTDQRVPTVAPGPEQFVVVSFDVPEGAGGTCLSSLAPSYWELVIDARADGNPFLDRFLVPVYERPR